MKHHDPRRPIGRCKGCCLNMRTFCAAGVEPKATWDTGRCKHYGDAELLAAVKDSLPPTGARRARIARRAKARAARSEPHHDGVLDPGKMAGRMRREP